MSLDFKRLRDSLKSKLLNDPDGKYGPDDAQPLDSDELEALMHYFAQAIVEEIDLEAEIKAGVDVEDSNGNKIGETRQSSSGVID